MHGYERGLESLCALRSVERLWAIKSAAKNHYFYFSSHFLLNVREKCACNLQCNNVEEQCPIIFVCCQKFLIPDGGWGWVVCIAAFVVNFIADGTMFSFGILLLELLDDFHESKALTSWVGSAQLGMSMLMGRRTIHAFFKKKKNLE